MEVAHVMGLPTCAVSSCCNETVVITVENFPSNFEVFHSFSLEMLQVLRGARQFEGQGDEFRERSPDLRRVSLCVLLTGHRESLSKDQSGRLLGENPRD